MSTHDLKAQQSSCQSGVKASVTCVVSDQESFYTHTDKSRFQNVSEQEKLHPIPTASHVNNKEETRTTASPPSLQLKGQQKSSRDLQIKQIILFGSKQERESRFTSTISIKLPVKRIKKDTTEEKTSQATTNLYGTLEAGKNTANQHHTELRDVFSPTEQCGESTAELLKDGQKATFDEDALHQHGQNTGIQHNIGHEQARIDPKDSLRHNSTLLLVHEVQTEVKKESGASDCRENDPTTQHNLGGGLKVSTESQLFNQVLSLACFPASHSENSAETKASSLNPTSAMLTSALVSVLAPPWSGRLRRPKQGVSEVETAAQDSGQNVNPSTLIRQDRRQQPFLPFQRQPIEQMLANDNNIQVTAGTSYSPDWQKENNSPNVTTTIPQKRPIMKSSSVGTMYNREPHTFPTTLDAHQEPNLPHSGYRILKTGDENEPFKSLSSKPTTSSLLLSLRRSNLRNSNVDPTQPQTQITRSLRSLTLPSRVVLKTHSFAQSETPDDQIDKYPDTPTRTEGIPVAQFRFSPRLKSRVPLRTSMFLNKQETDISKRLEATVSAADPENEHFPPPTTKISQLGGLKAEQSSYSVLRRYSSIQNIDSVDQSTGNSNSNNTTQQITPDTMISPERSNFHVQNIKSQSTHSITASSSSATSTFTDRLNFSPRKDSSVDGLSPTNVGQIYSKKHSHSSQSSMDLSSPISPSRPLRSVRVPSIYSYLRESSPSSPSTPSSHIQKAEASPPKQDGRDWKTLPSRFSFDFNPSVPQEQALQKSTHTAPAQSLPPDFRRGSAPRLSTSPYSSLISSRPALNSTLQGLSSPPSSKTQSTSYDIGTTQPGPSSLTSTYTGISREELASSDREHRTTVQAYTSDLDNHRPAQPCLSQAAPDASFVMESQSANISSHPRQPNTGSNNFPQLEHDDSMALRLDKHKLSEKEKYLLPNKLNVEGETTVTHERLQEMQTPNSKKGLFASRVKKDNAFSSASLPDKEVGSSQYLKTKRHLPVFRTTSRIDQMLNRFKLTFGVKRSDSTLDTVTKKSRSQQRSDIEIPKTDEKTWSQQGTSDHSLTIDKASLGSLSPMTTEFMLNTDDTGCMEVPYSSLTTDEATFESLSPFSVKKSEKGLNMDWRNRSTATNNDQKASGCMWEASSPSFTIDKTHFESLTVNKSENTLLLDWQNRSTNDEQKGCTWDAPSSTLTTGETHFGSSSPLMSKKSFDQQKRESSENGSQSYGKSFSHHRIKAQNMNRSATLPHYRKSSFGLTSPFYLFDFDSEDNQNDSVFYSPVSKKTNSLCESDDFSPLSSAKSSLQQNLVRSRLSSSCADLKYGLHGGRSFSVSSVVSSRPSGPGRISTSSTSDLSSLDDFVPKGNQTLGDSPMNTSHSPSYVTGRESQTGFTDDYLEHDFEDPTPPPSPTLSSSPRRISQAPAMSSPIRTTPENLSPPRSILPSRSFKTSLSVYEESGSDTTTDDEYYLGNGDDDDLETEL